MGLAAGKYAKTLESPFLLLSQALQMRHDAGKCWRACHVTIRSG
jgi:hypothetical protein